MPATGAGFDNSGTGYGCGFDPGNGGHPPERARSLRLTNRCFSQEQAA
jgi:hypothetical protein